MTGNITEEQFVKFCEDFVNKFKGKNFHNVVKSFHNSMNASYHGVIDCFMFECKSYELTYGEMFKSCLFCYNKYSHYMYINCLGKSYELQKCYFHNIEDIYKFFKMNEEENKETIEITLEVNLEDILKIYKEDISKKLGIASENIKINLKRG